MAEKKNYYEILGVSKTASEEEIKAILNEKFADVIATKNKGQIMKAVMAELKGKADGKLINKVVGDLCQS